MRDESIDRAKGILIFLVVLGHVVGMMRYVAGESVFAFLNQLYTAIYLFHVPAFFFLAGYVSGGKGRCQGGRSRSTADESSSFYICTRRKVRRLVVPYFVWGVVSVCVFLALRGLAGLITHQEAYQGLVLDGPWWQPFLSLLHAGGWPNGRGFICNGVLWFLPVMFVVSILFEGVRRSEVKVYKGRIVPCLIASGCFVLGGVIQFYGPRGLPWGLSVAPYYLGYMLVGRIVGQWRRVGADSLCCDATGVSRPRRAVAGCVLGWGVYSGLAWCWPDLGLRSQLCGWYVFGVLMALLGSYLVLATARLLPRIPLLGAFGQTSLTIMLAHKFLVLPVQVGLGWVAGRALVAKDSDGTVAGVWLVAAVVVSVGITYLTYRLALVIRRTVPFVLGEKR